MAGRAGGDDVLLVEDRERVRTITLNRPDKRNALTLDQWDGLVDTMREAERDRAVGAVVVRGNGPSFSAGVDIDPSQMDMDYESRSLAHEITLLDRFQRFSEIWNLRTPVVASVHGHCLGVGTDLVFHCDVVLAATDAQFGYPIVRSMGSPPTHMWTYLAGPQWAKRLLLTGDSIDGATAARAGLVLEAVPPEELAEASFALARKMAMISPDVLSTNKAICNKVMELMGRTLAQELAREHNAMAHQSPDAMEFGRIAGEQGLKAALAWQRDRFS